jgi:hypothetical protein
MHFIPDPPRPISIINALIKVIKGIHKQQTNGGIV